jgi:hypothetical protein
MLTWRAADFFRCPFLLIGESGIPTMSKFFLRPTLISSGGRSSPTELLAISVASGTTEDNTAGHAENKSDIIVIKGCNKS